jgi:CheY-like chemotaxis protein
MMERGTSGFDIAQQLRREPGLARLPVLMLTAIHQSTKLRFSPETDGEYLPVDQFLDKPVRPEVLVTRVAELLKAAGQ